MVSWAVVLGFLALTLGLLGRRLLVAAGDGCSMAPTLQPGAIVVADRVLWRLLGLRRGDLVVARLRPCGDLAVVKRVSRCSRHGRQGATVFLTGDDRRTSVDSRAFGPLPRDAVLGRVWFALSPPHWVARALGRRSTCHAWGGRTHIHIANTMLHEIAVMLGDAGANVNPTLPVPNLLPAAVQAHGRAAVVGWQQGDLGAA